jgi:hypothetical protein
VESLPTLHDLKALHPSAQVAYLTVPHRINYSFNCDHSEACECHPTINCPLCADPIPSVDSNHYERMHWEKRKVVNVFTIFPCYLKHSGQTKVSIEHWHCPACPLITHDAKHLSFHYEINHDQYNTNFSLPSEWYCLSNEWQESRIDVHDTSVVTKLSFSPSVSYRGFPLCISFLEQLGCNVGEVLGKSERRAYSRVYDIPDFRQFLATAPIFRGFCFLLFGQGFPADFLSLIFSVSGQISGAQYSGSPDWRKKVTHILIGPEVSISRYSKFKRAAPSHIQWVDCAWIVDCVGSGSLQPVISAGCRIKHYFKPQAVAPVLVSSPTSKVREANDENFGWRQETDFDPTPIRRSRRLSAISSP